MVQLSDFIDEIERVLGKPIEKILLGMQKGDVPATLASPRLLNALTGFTPETHFSRGIADFVAWYKDYYSRAGGSPGPPP